MKSVHFVTALLLCSPVAAWAQAPRPVVRVPVVPEAPIVPTLPVPAEVPVQPDVPPLPVVAATPAPARVPAVPIMPVLAQGLVGPDAVTIDPSEIEQAVRASQDAIQQLDIDVIKEKALDLQAMKEQIERMKEDAIVHARDLAHQNADMQSFAFQMRGRVDARRSDEGNQYDAGMNALQRRQYDQAISLLDQVIAQKGAHADGALYWKAYALYMLGRTNEALAAITELRQQHAQSRYLNDARVLEAEARKSSGQPLSANADNDEIKLLAIQGIQNSNPDGAIPLLDGVLKATNSLQVKKRALFVLAQNDQPAAHQLLVSYAKGSGNPDLQLEAIRYLVDRRRQTTGAELSDIYNATQDVDVRRAVLNALISSRDRPALLKIVGSDSSPEIRRIAIGGLGSNGLMSPQELMDLYRKEDNKDLRTTIVRAMGSIGATDQLIQIVRSENDPAVRLQAIRSLGSSKPEATGQALVDLYTGTQDKDVRKAVISALGNQNNADGLIAIARKETSSDLKLEIVRRISDLAPKNKAAMDYLTELIK